MSGTKSDKQGVKKVIFNLIILGFMVGMVELGAMIYFKRAAWRFTFNDPRAHVKTMEEIAPLKPFYSKELGIDLHPEGRRLVKDFGTNLMTTYGDSFTEGDEVEDDQTWQTAMSARLQANVLNQGHNGYGTDQAFLRFKLLHEKYPTPMVALCLISENINRCVNVYRPYYNGEPGAYLPKPRFLLEEGRNVLQPNPMKSVDDLHRLTDPDFYELMGKNDRWYNVDGKPTFGFPYSRLLFSKYIWTVLSAQARGEVLNQIGIRPGEGDTWTDPEARKIMLNIIDDFFAEAEAKGTRPVLVYIPMEHEVVEVREGGVPNAARIVREHCAVKKYRLFDGLPVFAESEHDPDDLFGFTHPSRIGTRLFGEAFADYVEKEKP